MATFGKCKICGEKISYSPDHIDNYANHLMEKHPDQEFAHFPMMYETKMNMGGGSTCVCGCESRKASRSNKGRLKPQSYKTCVQSWKNAMMPMLCPRCGKNAPPLIKRQRSKLTTSSCIACLILGCWPLCFLPFIVSGSDLFYVYCKECGYFIGMYDRRTDSRGENVPPCRIPGTEGAAACGCA